MFLNNAQIIQGLNFTSSQVIMCDPPFRFTGISYQIAGSNFNLHKWPTHKKIAKYYLHTPDIAIKWLIIKYSNLPYW